MMVNATVLLLNQKAQEEKKISIKFRIFCLHGLYTFFVVVNFDISAAVGPENVFLKDVLFLRGRGSYTPF